ncbi:MAG: hypothetical protein B6I20_10770 [Bacteroidetes bacterium 4572_117]|nr:MAG: hypothetical protein B6I20_10770 [Bacteroidetes bacterium 4572_117]
MKKIKILHIEDWFHPEMGYQLNYFAKYHSLRFEFIILSSDSLGYWSIENTQLQHLDKKYEQDHNVKIHRLPIIKRKTNKQFLLIKGLIQEIQKISPDIIYVHAIETYTSIRILMQKNILKKYTVIADTHTLLSQFNDSFSFKLYSIFFRKCIVSKVNRYKIKVFATANENHDILLNNYGIGSNLIEDTIIGTDSEVFYYDNKARLDLRRKLNIKLASTVLIYAGKFNVTKMPHLILESLKHIENEIYNEFDLVFVGSKEPEYFKTHFNYKFDNPNIKIHILDTVNNNILHQYYSMADFAVFPSESTLSALDAQLCNLPVIMENDNTNSLRLKEGGFVYKKNNLQHLAVQILKLYKNKDLRDELAIKGKKYVLDKFAYQNIVKKVESIILNYHNDGKNPVKNKSTVS